jgi:hypothetical protein
LGHFQQNPASIKVYLNMFKCNNLKHINRRFIFVAFFVLRIFIGNYDLEASYE